MKFEHTVFALPFAYSATLLAMNDGRLGHDSVHVDWSTVLFVTLAMVGARTLAMGLNRIIDAEIDARNPRTAIRESPSGTICRASACICPSVRPRASSNTQRGFPENGSPSTVNTLRMRNA